MSKHRGSNFDDFLREQGLLEQAELEAAARVLAFLREREEKESPNPPT